MKNEHCGVFLLANMLAKTKGEFNANFDESPSLDKTTRRVHDALIRTKCSCLVLSEKR